MTINLNLPKMRQIAGLFLVWKGIFHLAELLRYFGYYPDKLTLGAWVMLVLIAATVAVGVGLAGE